MIETVRPTTSENYIGTKQSKSSFELRLKGKKKHNLLLRRNTCTSLDLSGVVAHDFWTIMQDSAIRDAFFEFLQKRRCTENLLFYEAVMRWKFQGKEGRWEEANKIFNMFVLSDITAVISPALYLLYASTTTKMFISDQAPSQVNLSAKTTKQLKWDLRTLQESAIDLQSLNEYNILPTTLYNTALREVELLLKLELLPTFATASLLLKTSKDHRTCVIL